MSIYVTISKDKYNRGIYRHVFTDIITSYRVGLKQCKFKSTEKVYIRYKNKYNKYHYELMYKYYNALPAKCACKQFNNIATNIIKTNLNNLGYDI